GTDKEEISGGRADAPLGSKDLIIGHEMFGQVVDIGTNVISVKKGDYALFSVRRGCGKCTPCNNNRSDMCYTGQYTERGIKQAQGYQTEYIIDDEDYVVKIPNEIAHIGVLTEPMSIVEKAISESLSIQMNRLSFEKSEEWLKGKRALVAGLGPVGLLASIVMLLKDAEVTGLDIVDDDTLKPTLLKSLGGKYINGLKIDTAKIDEKFGEYDFIFEATGIAKLEFQLIDALAINGIYALTGIPGGDRPECILGAEIMRQIVLKNQIILGSVNAAPEHFKLAVDDLSEAYKKWGDKIEKIITNKIPYDKYLESQKDHSHDDIKVVIVWSE
ncbi:MAG TPA: glucose 1-dehydrogenase, partial [Ignavibacteriaceae bacterium]|nr:glucose 1-dehydrogenase [Ignavibacteriaceae bacterium]